jgi:hypothetical protein
VTLSQPVGGLDVSSYSDKQKDLYISRQAGMRH